MKKILWLGSASMFFACVVIFAGCETDQGAQQPSSFEKPPAEEPELQKLEMGKPGG